MKVTRLFRTAAVVACLIFGSRVAWAQPATTPTAVSFQQVIDYLNLEVKEEKILKMLANSPTAFTLGEAQVQQLRDAGASEALIAAMEKKGTALQNSSDISDFLVVLDCSGSMKEPAEPGISKWDAARRAAADIIQSVPEGKRLAFIIYGHDLTRRCGAVDLVRELSPVDAAAKDELCGELERIIPSADTPLAASLNYAGNVLRNANGLAKVIVITDGMETCQGRPEEEASQLAAMPHLKGGVDVIGFGLKREEITAVERIALAGRGQFFNADSVARLRESVATVQRQIVRPKPASPTGLSALDQRLIQNLSDPDCAVRAGAATTLGKRKVIAAVPALMKVISSDQWQTGADFDGSTYYFHDAGKECALQALLIIDRSAAEKAMMDATRSSSPDVRTWAVDRIGEHNLRNAQPALVGVITNDLWVTGIYVRATNYAFSDATKSVALDVLQKFDRQAAEEALVKAMESPKSEVRAWANKMISELSESPQ